MPTDFLWAELYVRHDSAVYSTEQEARAHRFNGPASYRTQEHVRRWLAQPRGAQTHEWVWCAYGEFWPDCVTVYLDGWNKSTLIPCTVTRNNHNWNNTTRYDVRFANPVDGYDWYGRMISGGDNSTFKARRVKGSPLVRHVEHLRKPERHWRVKDWTVQPSTVPGYFQLIEGGSPILCATHREGKWLYGSSVPDVVTQILLPA